MYSNAASATYVDSCAANFPFFISRASPRSTITVPRATITISSHCFAVSALNDSPPKHVNIENIQSHINSVEKKKNWKFVLSTTCFSLALSRSLTSFFLLRLHMAKAHIKLSSFFHMFLFFYVGYSFLVISIVVPSAILLISFSILFSILYQNIFSSYVYIFTYCFKRMQGERYPIFFYFKPQSIQ